MANYTDNGIQFNNVKEYTTFVNGNVGVKGTQGVDPEWGGVINAIDIDWNGGQFKYTDLPGILSYSSLSYANNIVNTTGQLLSVIDYLKIEIDDIRYSMDEISYQVSYIMSNK